MARSYRRSAFLFRRDLRLADNTGLLRAAAMSAEVLPCFVFDPAQVDPGRNPYFGAPAFQILLEGLEDLDRQLAAAGGRLNRFHGDPAAVVARLLGEHGVEAVFVNRDYTPFAAERDGRIEEACSAREIPFHRSHDQLLTWPGQVVTGGGTPYRTFTPFFRAARGIEVPRPAGEAGPPGSAFARSGLSSALGPGIYRQLLPERRPLHARGGRAEAFRILEDLERFRAYDEERNLLAPDGNPPGGASGLSPHLRHGTVSIREVYHAVVAALGRDHQLVRQLYWRDFFSQLAFFEPRVFGHAFRREYDAIDWEDDERLFAAWCSGRTGFPLVDAGMRQLAATGYLPNRVRMLAASFLVKDLHVDWRRGERWFARHLVDYDPAVNNGNWQWAASTGADAQPYFRVFNPWRQQERHDPHCAYVKRWVPELAGLAAAEIHALE
ncbi:MAG TPA: deoxyribodipyrimidine photo-lyase, partial [Thermoanaerobaculia bacterium]|nr:deoxyribodipyrimidine photo-lyase [Thermoanaerobaculia bacterium]